MHLKTIRLSNFQAFGPTPEEITFEEITYILGPNGAGKTTVLEALSRLFSPIAAQRRIEALDFHVPIAKPEEDPLNSPTLWIEADFEFPEAGETDVRPAVPPFFAHMSLATAAGPPSMRIRLTAVLEPDGNVTEQIDYVLDADESGVPLRTARMSRTDRAHIEVHYLPARRDPSEQISYASASLLGRTLRAATWTAEEELLADLTEQMTTTLASNAAVANIGVQLAEDWVKLHRGDFFKDPTLAFGSKDIESALRQLTLRFSPGHGADSLQFERLSDGQKSLLYISLVLAWQAMGRKVLRGEDKSVDINRLRPPVHTIFAIEEPENSLAPQYLGRIMRSIKSACEFGDAQGVVATHAPAMLRRTRPESIRYLRLNERRETTVRSIIMPQGDSDAAKFVREAVEAYPELYFARLVVLGEGDSEQIVLPRILAAAGIAEDDASVTVVPLGGRHVNHFWRLLNGLDIPHVTLLDLDCARYQGGWGRVSYALKQLRKVRADSVTQAQLDAVPSWREAREFPTFSEQLEGFGASPVAELEQHGVFYSTPLDLDLMMMEAYPEAYVGTPAEPTASQLRSVLGKSRRNVEFLPEDSADLFGSYHQHFKLSSKPVAHLSALALLDDQGLIDGLPPVLGRLLDRVRVELEGIPE
ncbi:MULTISPECIES: ATP-dependent nuclease [unclassified Microbacterium]|nr:MULTISPECIES: AAA family ATPase [unclassified Microbacterium]